MNDIHAYDCWSMNDFSWIDLKCYVFIVYPGFKDAVWLKSSLIVTCAGFHSESKWLLAWACFCTFQVCKVKLGFYAFTQNFLWATMMKGKNFGWVINIKCNKKLINILSIILIKKQFQISLKLYAGKYINL